MIDQPSLLSSPWPPFRVLFPTWRTGASPLPGLPFSKWRNLSWKRPRALHALRSRSFHHGAEEDVGHPRAGGSKRGVEAVRRNPHSLRPPVHVMTVGAVGARNSWKRRFTAVLQDYRKSASFRLFLESSAATCGKTRGLLGRTRDLCGRIHKLCGMASGLCGVTRVFCGRTRRVSGRPQGFTGRTQGARPRTHGIRAGTCGAGGVSGFAGLLVEKFARVLLKCSCCSSAYS